MKHFVKNLLCLLGLVASIGGPAYCMLSFGQLTGDAVMAWATRVSTPGFLIIALLVTAHAALTLSVRPGMPALQLEEVGSFIPALLLGVSALPFLLLVGPMTTPASEGLAAAVEFVGAVYGLLVGCTLTVIALSAIVLRLIDEAVDHTWDTLGF